MIVGTVAEIWRYPVKSMAGGRLERTELGELGIPGDRGWALRDEQANEIRGAKKLPQLLRCAARYLTEPTAASIPPEEITLPDGTTVRSDDPAAGKALSNLLGREVTLWPRQPPDRIGHYRRQMGTGGEMEAELRSIFGREADEPLPDLSVFPPELFEYTSPLGTYFDAFPLHLVTTAWLDDLSRRNPAARFDRRRFRPNLLIRSEGGAAGRPELEWGSRELHIGEAVIEVTVPCPRCVMTTLPQEGLDKDPSVLRTIVRDSGQNVGVYARVSRPGVIRNGAVVELR